MIPLPIDPFLAEIRSAVVQSPIVLVDAPPGSGKTTRVGPALLDLLADHQVAYLLQPRRLAARSVAARIAEERGERIGGRIGYSVRFDQQLSRDTQLIVATEGIVIRRLQDDPTLAKARIVLLDEFHERSLDADLLLAMLRRVQQTVRDDLRIVIMSATLDRTSMQSALGDVPMISVPANQYPVSIRFRPPKPQVAIVEHAAEVLEDVSQQHDGDVLAFLPGSGEILRCIDLLKKRRLDRDFDLLPLYGAMPIEDQMRAIETGPRRRIVVATNVAETSLTIPGIRTVVDSGQARVLRFFPEVGLDRLVLENISSASATQRAGRAGRVAPGTCYRLWSEASDRSRAPFLEPEIRRIDLSSAILELIAWGEGASLDFPWLEAPREDAVASARRLLEMLGAVRQGKITETGYAMVRLPLPPRLSRIAVEAAGSGCLDQVCWLVAMLSDRDPFDRMDRRRSTGSHGMPTSHAMRWTSDCLERLAAIDRFRRTGQDSTPFGTVHRGSLRNIEQSARQIRQMCESLVVPSTNSSLPTSELLERILLSGYPDRVARRRQRGKPQGLMVGGKGVAIGPQSGVTEPEFFLCIDVEQKPGDAIVRQASRIEADWLRGDNLVERDDLFFHPSQKQVVARRRRMWIDLILSETPAQVSDEEESQRVLAAAVKTHWEQSFPKDNVPLLQWIERVNSLRRWMPELQLPELDQSALQETAWELCRGKRLLAEVRDGPWLDWLSGRLTPDQRRALEREAPERIQVPSGSWIRLEYAAGKPPILAVKIQEIFSWKATPRIAAGRIPLLLHLLAPNMRPQQVTEDLASFWKNGYGEVKKELKRRYPKHSWPDDPMAAAPVRK
ncbi:MAG: ATP-dependent helicase HrpB [Planctomycetota bacterium]